MVADFSNNFFIGENIKFMRNIFDDCTVKFNSSKFLYLVKESIEMIVVNADTPIESIPVSREFKLTTPLKHMFIVFSNNTFKNGYLGFNYTSFLNSYFANNKFLSLQTEFTSAKFLGNCNLANNNCNGNYFSFCYSKFNDVYFFRNSFNYLSTSFLNCTFSGNELKF